jgi:hypothetical protein
LNHRRRSGPSPTTSYTSRATAPHVLASRPRAERCEHRRLGDLPRGRRERSARADARSGDTNTGSGIGPAPCADDTTNDHPASCPIDAERSSTLTTTPATPYWRVGSWAGRSSGTIGAGLRDRWSGVAGAGAGPKNAAGARTAGRAAVPGRSRPRSSRAWPAPRSRPRHARCATTGRRRGTGRRGRAPTGRARRTTCRSSNATPPGPSSPSSPSTPPRQHTDSPSGPQCTVCGREYRARLPSCSGSPRAAPVAGSDEVEHLATELGRVTPGHTVLQRITGRSIIRQPDSGEPGAHHSMAAPNATVPVGGTHSGSAAARITHPAPADQPPYFSRMPGHPH